MSRPTGPPAGTLQNPDPVKPATPAAAAAPSPALPTPRLESPHLESPHLESSHLEPPRPASSRRPEALATIAEADSKPSAPIVPAGAPPNAPRTAVQVVTPAAPPPRPAAARERAAPGLHIGTLEVNVVAPTPPALPPAYRPDPNRVIGRAPTVRSSGITRGFGVFGLGQS